MTWTIETVREAPVAPDDVFQFYADPSTWSSWGHAAQWARVDGRSSKERPSTSRPTTGGSTTV